MMSGLPLMRAAAAACKTNEIGARECSGGKQHLGIKSLGCCSLALLPLPNLSLPLRFSSLLLALLLLPNLSLPLRFSGAFTFDGLQRLLG